MFFDRILRKDKQPPSAKPTEDKESNLKLIKNEEQKEIDKMPSGQRKIFDIWREKKPENPLSDWNKFWANLVQKSYPEELQDKINDLKSGESVWIGEGAPPPTSDKAELAKLTQEIEKASKLFEINFIERIKNEGVSEKIKKQIKVLFLIEEISRKTEK